ncbi:uncharacterized protein ATC70_000622 [Mucor velutinosus]|uniref:Uncharacterized protein n=1 Tax=Mucor velutinosus TaxID=708070 RepID=A0AAN7DIC0_9FUNG|nr:hypothetical protein ATC70_000622 [Mucor velutinosus]
MRAWGQKLANVDSMRIASCLAKAYVTFVRLNVFENIEERTIRYFITILPGKNADFIWKRRYVAFYIWNLKVDPGSVWPPTISKNAATSIRMMGALIYVNL